MSAPDEDAEIDAPDLVHWSPRRGPTVGSRVAPVSAPLGALGLVAVAGLAFGALAVGAFAIGAMVVGRLAVGKAELGEVRIGRLEVGDLVVLNREG